MYLKILLTTTILSLIHIANIYSQTSFPFDGQSENHSSYHGLVASASVSENRSIGDAAQALRFEDTYTETSSINNATGIIKDSNGNAIDAITNAKNSGQDSKIVSKSELVNVSILFDKAGYACSNELELTLGFETYTMNDLEKTLKLPEGRYFYRVKGGLSCSSTDGCQIDNTGIVDINGDTNLVLTWQVTDYQNCWMTLRRNTYFTSVID